VICVIGTYAGCGTCHNLKSFNLMSILSQSIVSVKRKATRVALQLQMAYSCKIAELVAELDPEDLVQFLDSAKQGEVLEVAILIAIYIRNLV
jgi:ribosomal 50S subunit-associated protein YjgA (DUF615 family)